MGNENNKQHTGKGEETEQTLSATRLSLVTKRRKQLRAIHHILAELQDSVWLDALANATNVHIKSGQVMFANDQFPGDLKLILDGSIRVYQLTADGREISLFRVQPGDLCFLNLGGAVLSPLSNFFSNTRMSITAVSDTEVSALQISLIDYDRLMDESKTFRNYVLALSRKRIFQLVRLIGNSVFLDMDLRLADYLLQYFEKNPGGPLEITHFKLAQELGTTREVVSRGLNRFKSKNYVQLERGRIKLVSRTGLQSI